MELHLPVERDIDAWQLYLWNLAEDVLSRPQKLQFMLMLDGAFNEFDPFLVLADLLKHRDLWQGIVMDRGWILPEEEGAKWYHMATDLIKLRDMSTHWNVDTLLILTDKESPESCWNDIVKNWKADEVGWIEGPDVNQLLGSYPSEQKILTVWWD